MFLTKPYGSRRGVEKVDLSVAEGEVFGFLGPNGAGKTTTIRCLLGVRCGPRPGGRGSSGSTAGSRRRRSTGGSAFLPSEPGYLGELTAAEQLGHLAALRGLAAGGLGGLAERLELDPTVQIRRLSRGNRQKVGRRRRLHGRRAAADHGRADDGPRPAHPARVPAPRRRGQGRRPDRVPLLAQPAGGRARAATGSRSSATAASSRCRRSSNSSGSHWRSVNLVLAQPAPAGAFDLPNVQVVSADAPRRPPHGPRRRESDSSGRSPDWTCRTSRSRRPTSRTSSCASTTATTRPEVLATSIPERPIPLPCRRRERDDRRAGAARAAAHALARRRGRRDHRPCTPA